MSTFILDIISPEARKYVGQVEYVSIPGVEGDFGVYARHAPLITKLRPSGIVQYRVAVAVKVEVFYVFGGFAEVQPTQVTILADTVIRGPEVDQARMKAAMALENLLDIDHSDQPIDYQRAMAEINNFYLQSKRLNTQRQLYH